MLLPEFFKQVAAVLAGGRSLCLATIIAQSGSAPRPLGTVFAVDPGGGIIGSIGGGRLEAEVMDAAPQTLAAGQAVLMDFSLTGREAAQLEMICGGEVRVYLEPLQVGDPQALALARAAAAAAKDGHGFVWTLVQPGAMAELAGRKGVWRPGEDLASLPAALIGQARAGGGPRQPAWAPGPAGAGGFFLQPLLGQPVVYLFGGGHISLYLAPMLSLVGFGVVVVDDRPEFAGRDRFPQADGLLVRPFAAALEGLSLDERSYVVIITRGHLHDKDVLAQVLRAPAAYLGMIGSRRKKALIYQALLAEGYTQAELERVHAPIGLSIGAETPAEIAVSIVAELIAVRARLSGSERHLTHQVSIMETKTCPAG
ncbi:MAG: XdhC family protein [Pseudomonadota bacterium]